MGRQILQHPQDIVAMQEITWNVRPDLIIETGIAYGGSLIFYASLLEVMGHGTVVGVEINLYKANRLAIEAHPLFNRIKILDGSSIAYSTFAKVREIAKGKKTLVCLDSNHTHDHVLRELNLYSPLVTKGSYMVVFDTMIENLPARLFKGKPYGKGNNPATAVREFLKTNPRFEIDKSIDDRLMASAAPEGYLKCLESD